MQQRGDEPQQPYAPYQPQWTQAPKPKKKHRARNISLGVIGGFAALIIIGAATSGGKTPTPAAAATTPTAPASYSAPHQAPAADPTTTTPDAELSALLASLEAPDTQASVPEQVTYHCTGSAPDGVDITYGPEGSDYSAGHLPFSKTMSLDDNAEYFDITAQLSGGGHVTCTTTVQTSDGTKTVKTATASGGYNIASAEVCGDFMGGWEAC